MTKFGKKLDVIALWLEVMDDRLPAKDEDIKNINWEEGGRIHNWRRHIPDWAKKNWEIMTNDMRLGIIFMAQTAANKEEYD